MPDAPMPALLARLDRNPSLKLLFIHDSGGITQDFWPSSRPPVLLTHGYAAGAPAPFKLFLLNPDLALGVYVQEGNESPRSLEHA